MTFPTVGKSVLAAAALICPAAAASAQVPTAQHVVLVIDENSSYSSVVANMPWLVGQGDANGYATHYQSDNGNDCYYPGTATTDPITDDNIFRDRTTKAGVAGTADDFSAGLTVTVTLNSLCASPLYTPRLGGTSA